MNPDTVSFLLMFGGPLCTVFMIAFQRPGLGTSAAAVTTGVIVGLANLLAEYLAARHKIYFVSGLIPVGHSSLALTIGWMSLAACFVLGSERLRKYSWPRLALATYAGAGILAGLFSDYLGAIAFGHFKLGPNGNWLYICLVWVILLPGALFIYKISQKAIK